MLNGISEPDKHLPKRTAINLIGWWAISWLIKEGNFPQGQPIKIYIVVMGECPATIISGNASDARWYKCQIADCNGLMCHGLWFSLGVGGYKVLALARMC